MIFAKRISAILAVWAALLTAGTLCAGQEPKPIPLEDAVRQGLVKVDVTSYGGAYGDAIQVAVQRLVKREVRVVVEPGTVFVSVGGDVQNMVARRVKGEMIDADTYRPADVMVLADGTRHPFLVESYCLDYQKPAPRANDRFRLAGRDPRATRILVNTPLVKVDVSVGAIQSALWMDRAGVSAEELQRRYPFTTVDVRVAGDLLRRVREIAASRTLPIPPVIPDPGPDGTSVRVEIGAAAEAVEAMLKNRPIEPLVASLKSPRVLLRRHAARTLGLVGNPRAVPALVIALRDPDERVQELAEASLKQITKQDFGQNRVKWLTWWEKNKERLLAEGSPQPQPSPQPKGNP